MRQIGLVFKRTFINRFGTIKKSLLMIIALGILFVSMALGMVIGFTGTNKLPDGVEMIIITSYRATTITALVLYVGRTVINDTKKGFIKNLFANGFTKQQYFLGTILFWTSMLIASSVIALILLIVVWQTEGSPQNVNMSEIVLFVAMYYFIIPIILFIFLMGLIWISFRVGKSHSIQEVFFVIMMVITFAYGIILTMDKNDVWVEYIMFLIPFYNFIYAFSYTKETSEILYWWVYVIDAVYTLAFIGTLYFTRKDNWFKINGKAINKFF